MVSCLFLQHIEVRQQFDEIEALQCLQRFAERAWRRPVSLGEIEPYAKLVATEREAGQSFDDAYRSALASILVSRSFFNLEQGSPTENRQHLTDFELASRLSYFLWSSMPDDQLFQAALDGRLTSPKGLSEQLDRMLEDAKTDRFINSFPKQILSKTTLFAFNHVR